MSDTPDPAEALARELERVVLESPPMASYHALARHVLAHYVAATDIRAREESLRAQVAKMADRIADLTTERDELRRRIRVISGVEPSDEARLADVMDHANTLMERRLRVVRDSHPEHVEADATLRAYLRAQGRPMADEAGLTPEAARAHVEAHAAMSEGVRLYCQVCGRAVSESGLCPDAGRHQRDAAQPMTLEHVYLRLQAESERVDRQIKRLDFLEHASKAQHTTGGGLLERLRRHERRVDLCVEHMEQRYAELDSRMERYVDNFATEVADLAAKSAQLTELIVELAKDVQALASKMEGGE